MEVTSGLLILILLFLSGINCVEALDLSVHEGEWIGIGAKSGGGSCFKNGEAVVNHAYTN